MEWRDRYNAVISSKRWRDIRVERIHLAGGKCEQCGCNRRLELHHKTYERLGEELPEDLQVLCRQCHAVADAERAEEGERRSEDALRDARFAGWARKVYGEEWHHGDVTDMYDRFVEWVDRKERAGS